MSGEEEKDLWDGGVSSAITSSCTSGLDPPALVAEGLDGSFCTRAPYITGPHKEPRSFKIPTVMEHLRKEC